MISKAQSKFIKSLQIKKYRKQEQCFIVEGRKSVEELLASDFEVTLLVGTPEHLRGYAVAPSAQIVETSPRELQSLGQFQSNEEVLAVARMRPPIQLPAHTEGYALVLDDIRDPGNLGTIIRTADWYGITTLIASLETADVYNSKVITASMGSFTRAQVHYTDLHEYLPSCKVPVYGTFLKGEDVHQATFGAAGLIVIGNESKGISPPVAKCITHRITIPRYGKAESLNAGIATAIVLDNLRRK